MTDQERILDAIQDPAAAKILSELWAQIQNEPIAAARMARAFQGAKQILTETLRDLPDLWRQLDDACANADLKRLSFTQDLRDFRAGTTNELKGAVEDLKVLEAFFSKLDDSEFLNKANRILDLCDKLAKAKREGTLDWIKKLT